MIAAIPRRFLADIGASASGVSVDEEQVSDKADSSVGTAAREAAGSRARAPLGVASRDCCRPAASLQRASYSCGQTVSKSEALLTKHSIFYRNATNGLFFSLAPAIRKMSYSASSTARRNRHRGRGGAAENTRTALLFPGVN
jgi:hypothetical protein